MLDSARKLIVLAIQQRDEITLPKHSDEDRERLVEQWRPKAVAGEFEVLYQRANAEAVQEGLGAVLLPKLEAAYLAHETLLSEGYVREEHHRALTTLIQVVNRLPAGGKGKEPEDLSAYRPARELCLDWCKTYPAIGKLLRKNPSIRTRKPSKQRLLVHAGDWAKFVAEEERKASELLDSNSPAVTNLLDGMANRKDAIPKDPNRKPRSLK